MAPCVDERARSISRRPEHCRRRELLVLCGVCLDLVGGEGAIAVAVSWAEHDPLELEGVGAA